jgi:anaerobic selenocysteine-containing dehydrogenase
MSTVLRTTCNRDCPDSCSILATVEHGRVVGHVADPEHAVTRGFLCAKGNRYLRRQYHDQRVLRPRRRTWTGWENIGWDDALDLVASKLAEAREQGGPESVLAVTYSGLKGLVTRVLWRLFWGHFGGATGTVGGLSVEAALAAQRLDMGGPGTHEPEDLANSRAIVVWGKNIAVTRPHAWPFVQRARKAGAVLHVVDPVRCATARKADVHHALRPGTDAVLALAVGRLLVERGAIDEDFVRDHVAGFDGWRRLVERHTLAEAAQITDLPAAGIEELAELYANAKPLATMAGLGPAYWSLGGATVRLIDALAAVTGNLGVSGGGAHTDLDGSVGFDFSMVREGPKPFTRRIPIPQLGDGIREASDPPIKVAFVAGANPAATAPDTGAVLNGLRELDFLVVVDQFETASSLDADLFLPCVTYLEQDDLIAAYGHRWVGVTQRVVQPPNECGSDVEILQALADRLGFGPALAGSPKEWADRLMAPLRDEGFTFDALAAAPRINPRLPAIPFADGAFGTESGRFELVGELPAAEEPLEPGQLWLMATKTLKMVNAQIDDEELKDRPKVRLHPETMAELGLSVGEGVKVISEVGQVRALVVGDAAVRRDVLLFNPARWRGDLEGVNQLREARYADLDQAAAMHGTKVRLEPAFVPSCTCGLM